MLIIYLINKKKIFQCKKKRKKMKLIHKIIKRY